MYLHGQRISRTKTRITSKILMQPSIVYMKTVFIHVLVQVLPHTLHGWPKSTLTSYALITKVKSVNSVAGITHVQIARHIANTQNRSEEHTSALQSHFDLLCLLLHEKKN